MKYSLGFNEALQAQDRMRMFIDEQYAHQDLRAEYVSVEQVVWSPAANRHCCWMFPAGGNRYGKRLWEWPSSSRM